MPKGLFIIDWDEVIGGVITMQYPDDLEVPENFIQLLQISHNFNPGIMTVKEEGFHAISIGNLEAQKVIVLQLTKYEDGEDFYHIIETINEIIDEIEVSELKHLYELSEHAYKAREEVLQKLAEEVSNLKNYENDVQKGLEWLYKHEESWKNKIIILLLGHKSVDYNHIFSKTKLNHEQFEKYLQELIDENLVELIDGKIRLTIYYD